MVKGVILVDLTDQGRRAIKDSPDRAEASKAEAAKLGLQVKDLFYTPGGPHDAAIVIEAEGPEPINKFMSSVQSLGNVKMKFVRAFSIEEMDCASKKSPSGSNQTFTSRPYAFSSFHNLRQIRGNHDRGRQGSNFSITNSINQDSRDVEVRHQIANSIYLFTSWCRRG